MIQHDTYTCDLCTQCAGEDYSGWPKWMYKRDSSRSGIVHTTMVCTIKVIKVFVHPRIHTHTQDYTPDTHTTHTHTPHTHPHSTHIIYSNSRVPDTAAIWVKQPHFSRDALKQSSASSALASWCHRLVLLPDQAKKTIPAKIEFDQLQNMQFMTALSPQISGWHKQHNLDSRHPECSGILPGSRELQTGLGGMGGVMRTTDTCSVKASKHPQPSRKV